MFCFYLRTNSDLCHLLHKLIGFCNRVENCLHRGTDWFFKWSGLCWVFKGIIKYLTFTQHGFLFHDTERPVSILDTVLTLAHSHHISTVSSAANSHRALWQHATQKASSIHYCWIFLCSLASLKLNRIRQLMALIDSRDHPVKPVGVENEVTTPNCIAGFWGFDCHAALMICVQQLLKLALV